MVQNYEQAAFEGLRGQQTSGRASDSLSLFESHDEKQCAPLCITRQRHTIQESWQRPCSHAGSHSSSCEPAIPIADVQLSEVALVCDVVYRWVNPSSITPSIANKIRNQQRYRDNDELRFSMRSFAGMQGVRYLHTVAKGEPPSWLDVTHPRIFWWSETRLLNELRILRGIHSACSTASQPSWLSRASQTWQIVSCW